MPLGFNIGTEAEPEYVCPDRNFRIVSQPRVLTLKFGDGYGQKIKDGAYSRQDKYEITFINRTAEEIDSIIDYFENLKGVLSFEYILREEPIEKVLVICEEYTVIYSNKVASGCTATFRKVRN